MTNILHLSTTFLSGYPGRLSNLLNQTNQKYRSRCFAAFTEHAGTTLDVDMVGANTSEEAIQDRIRWADILHLHGIHSLGMLRSLGASVKGKRLVLQVYEHPEEGETDSHSHEAIPAETPYIITPVSNWAKWPTASFLAPEVPHFYGEVIPTNRERPLVSFDLRHTRHINSYKDVIFPLKKMQRDKRILYYPIENRIHDYAVKLKQAADIGIGDIIFGRYNTSALDYAAAGVACFCRVRGHTRDHLAKLTGESLTIPWIQTDKDHFLTGVTRTIDRKLWKEQGQRAKEWMEKHWNKDMIIRHYDEVYQSL